MEPKVRAYGFNEQLAASSGYSVSQSVMDILADNIPGAVSVARACESDDRSGVDWWVETTCDRLGVDLKLRTEDWARKGKDDLALEIWSVCDYKIGWTRDTEKRTDYILWVWQDTGRWCLLPFQMLCAVFQQHLEEWVERYQVAKQYTHGNPGWHSSCVYVPRRTVWRAIYRRYGGEPIQ